MGEHTSNHELRQLEAWEIAKTVYIGERIPADEHENLRSELYERYALKADYFETKENFSGAVHQAMKNDILDEIDRRRTKKAMFFASIVSLDDRCPDDHNRGTTEIRDPNITPEKFFGGLDRAERRRKMKNWRRKFRRQVRRLSDRLRDFLYKLDEIGSQEELITATGLCRKTCYLWRKKLQQIFIGLLREHREITAEE